MRQPFDFTAAMSALCTDVTQRFEGLAHVRMEQVLVTFAQTRRRCLHGLQAKLTPLRFEDGKLITQRGASQWTIRRMFRGEHEQLYILTFYLPRFQDQTLQEKFVTVFHELFHISPEFNGDIRRHEGRYHVHTASQREYDRQMAVYANQYLATKPSDAVWEFLKMDFRQLVARYGAVVGTKIAMPRLVRVPQGRSA